MATAKPIYIENEEDKLITEASTSTKRTGELGKETLQKQQFEKFDVMLDQSQEKKFYQNVK